MPEEKHKRSHQIIHSFEAQALKKRSFSVKMADHLTSVFGTIFFLLINLLLFAVWIAINSGKFPVIPVFDPFPFTLLTMVVSLEAIALSIIVLMSQNRQSQISNLRDELQLQVNLITEKEITKVLQLLKQMTKTNEGEITDAELEEMIKVVDTSYIERKLEEQLVEKPDSIVKEVAEEVEKVISSKE